MVDYYAERAREYERIYHKPERQDDLRQLRDFVADTFRGLAVLEVACGTGYWTEVLARSANSVLATDINESVLAIAREKQLGVNITFREADAYALPVSRQFNAVLSAFWWSHIPRSELRAFLLGLHSVLCPGARVVFIDNAYVEGSSTPISRRDENGDTYQIRRLDDGSIHEVRKNFPTEVHLRETVQEVATEVQVQFLKYYWILSYRVATESDG